MRAFTCQADPMALDQRLWQQKGECSWERGGNECKAGRGGSGKGWNFATCLRDTHARSLLQAAVRSSFACQPGSSLQKAACYFSLVGLFPHWLCQGGSAVGKVAKAEQKQLVPIADVLTAVCKMSLSALPPALEGWLADMRGTGYEKHQKDPSPYCKTVRLLLNWRCSMPISTCPDGGHLLAG